MMEYNIQGKRIIVTGSFSGIGAAVVDGYIREGARVAALDVQYQDADDLSDGVIRRRVDVTDRAQVSSVFDEAVGILGGLDVLVHAAGVHDPAAPSSAILDDDWDTVFDVNVKGTRNANGSAFRHLKDAGGAIINFGSRSGIVGTPRQGAYSAAKAAVHTWTRVIAQEWAEYNIRVNAVAPAMWTGMYDTYRERMSGPELAEHDASMAKQILLGGKLGDPRSDLVPLLVFLASDGSKFITGQCFPVDGGWLHTR